MGKEKIDALCRRMVDDTARMWMSPHDEVEKIKNQLGTMGVYATTLLYAESESRELVDYLFILRQAATKGPDKVSDGLKALTKDMLEFKADKWVRWYKIEKTPNLLREVASAVEVVDTKEEYLKLISATWQYINKWNYWLDLQVPWHAITTVCDWVVLGKDAPVK